MVELSLKEYDKLIDKLSVKGSNMYYHYNYVILNFFKCFYVNLGLSPGEISSGTNQAIVGVKTSIEITLFSSVHHGSTAGVKPKHAQKFDL